LAYADGVNIDTMQKNTNGLIDVRKEVGQEVGQEVISDRTKYKLMSRYQKTGNKSTYR
jgi:hypothetical protein